MKGDSNMLYIHRGTLITLLVVAAVLALSSCAYQPPPSYESHMASIGKGPAVASPTAAAPIQILPFPYPPLAPSRAIVIQ